MDNQQVGDLPQWVKVSVAAIVSLLAILGWYFLMVRLISGQYSGTSRRGHNVDHILRFSDSPLSFIAVSAIFLSLVIFISWYCFVLWKWIAK